MSKLTLKVGSFSPAGRQDSQGVTDGRCLHLKYDKGDASGEFNSKVSKSDQLPGL
jgi:hypothetical protein